MDESDNQAGMAKTKTEKTDSPADTRVLERLFAVIQGRKGADPDTSYTAKLFSRGPEKIAQKLGEEAVETVIASLGKDKGELAAESADLLYHLLVLWADRGLKPEAVWSVLAAREGTSGIAEKAARNGNGNGKGKKGKTI
jgi:phosphoribosyl-ATP pyrophosphohydrolase